jgi:hypothetical protein
VSMNIFCHILSSFLLYPLQINKVG